ncbi:response regulator transcription factor [Pinirhizobacter soli]|uniref:response regulator transcription factor n=1 Tax=Pinirhizobacter soli TaxID=2786953 RepID=UPI00202A5C21|nr:response regulator [Pinirhizobacter soli]
MENANTPCHGGLVLLLDEDSSSSRRIAEELRRHEYEVLVASDDEIATALAARFKPTLCVLELIPGRDNRLGLISRLRSIVPDMQIVVVTAYGSVATAVSSMKRGAKDYLVMPFKFEELLGALRSDVRACDEEVVKCTEAPLALRRAEWEYIQRVLNDCAGNISETARRLSMHRRTLQRKLNKRPVPERGYAAH